MNKVKLTSLPMVGVLLIGFFTSSGVLANNIIDIDYRQETAGGVCSVVKKPVSHWFPSPYDDDDVVRRYATPSSLEALRDNEGTVRVYCPISHRIGRNKHLANAMVKLDRGKYPKGNTVCKINYMDYNDTPLTAAYGSALKWDVNYQTIHIHTPSFVIMSNGTSYSNGTAMYQYAYLQCSLQPGERMLGYRLKYITLGE